ncbi:MAG: hypothetical protein AABY22_01165 [Nanoarchaeota archaeon]
MPITSEEILIILLEIIGSIILANFTNTDPTILVTIIIAVSLTILIFHRKISEFGEEMNNQKVKIQELDGKLKIHDRLARLENIVFKNGKKI